MWDSWRKHLKYEDLIVRQEEIIFMRMRNPNAEAWQIFSDYIFKVCKIYFSTQGCRKKIDPM